MDISDFNPVSGHLNVCDRSNGHSACDCDCAKVLFDLIPEVDRNARAYGWACGRAGGLLVGETTAGPDNPFLDPNWRERLT